jgi:hypothetical protein
LVGRAVDDVGEIRGGDGIGREHALGRDVDRSLTPGRLKVCGGRRDGVGVGDVISTSRPVTGSAITRRSSVADDPPETAALDPAGDATEVVVVVGPHPEPLERPVGRRHEVELFATVTGGQRVPRPSARSRGRTPWMQPRPVRRA